MNKSEEIKHFLAAKEKMSVSELNANIQHYNSLGDYKTAKSYLDEILLRDAVADRDAIIEKQANQRK